MVQDFCDEDETNHETNIINKENMNEFCNLIADQNPENPKHGKQNTTWCNFCSKKNMLWEGEDVSYT